MDLCILSSNASVATSPAEASGGQQQSRHIALVCQSCSLTLYHGWDSRSHGKFCYKVRLSCFFGSSVGIPCHAFACHHEQSLAQEQTATIQTLEASLKRSEATSAARAADSERDFEAAAAARDAAATSERERNDSVAAAKQSQRSEASPRLIRYVASHIVSYAVHSRLHISISIVWAHHMH